MRPTRLALSALLLTLSAVGCSLLEPREALTPRWFRPALPSVAPGAPAQDAPRLRLRPVSSAHHLGERIAWRVGDVEYGKHELLRWMEAPADVIERGLTEALFVSGRARRSKSASAAVLSVTVLRFEEQRQPEHRVEVELLATLHDPDGQALLSRRFSSGAPLTDDDPSALAREIGAVAGHQIDELVNAVVAALNR
ncbi:MAG: hypothetical protein DRQ55_08875 [Planctomycetota bacterium]|nr:MAG: hypothetical protein DRQ55_08875 [Planctomycetota bacterium]